MPIEEDLKAVSPDKETLLTIGVFDGVHLGHMSLISELIKRAREQQLISTVITFWPNPQEIISSGKRVPFLTDPEQRAILLKEAGVELVVTLPFTKRLASLSAEEFVSLLIKHLRICGLVVGPDFALGRSREGSTELLKRLGDKLGFEVIIMPPYQLNGTNISSTSIRKALCKGDMEKVRQMTGRYFHIHGKVVTGDGRGVELGFATANLDIDPSQAMPADGVYVARSYLDKVAYDSLVNIGKRPTFGGSNRVAEVHMLEFNNKLYGQELKTDIIKRLRGEMHFSCAEDLKKQISTDINKAKEIFKSLG